MGLMLESTSDRLARRGGPHFGSPDKSPAVRLEALRLAGEARVPFTTGLLIGIGETREERLDTLQAIAAAHAEHGHVQEVIVQNFRAWPGTKMESSPEPALEELLWTIACARLILPAEVAVQAPPNLSGEFASLLDAGIDDWGGVSPGHDRPRQPGGAVAGRRGAARGVQRRAGWSSRRASPSIRASCDRDWVDSAVLPAVAAARGLARAGPGGRVVARRDRRRAVRRPAVHRRRDALPVDSRDELGEDELARLFAARGEERQRVFARADALRREMNGDVVTYVVTRNVQYTNVCYFRCGFCAFSKGKLAANLRGEPYLVPHAEIVRRAVEAWDRGATEICLQGGIHPSFDGDYYASVVRAIKDAVPDLHVHAFSALEIWQGAATLGGRSRRVPRRACATRASPRCREPPPRSSTTRSGPSSAPTRSRRRSGCRCTRRRIASASART